MTVIEQGWAITIIFELMVLTLEKVPDSNAHDDHEDQDYELSIHLLLPSAIVAQSSDNATHSHGPLQWV
jgi:hypothetical protein